MLAFSEELRAAAARQPRRRAVPRRRQRLGRLVRASTCGDLRYAVGPGLRYQTPIGPIRFDFGYQLNPIPGLLVNGEPQTRRWRIHFSIGRRSRMLRIGALESSMRLRGLHAHASKRLIHVLVLVLTLVVGATAAAIIVSQTAWFKNWLRGYIVREANQYLNGTLSIERLGGNLFFGVEMENIGVSMDGSQVVAVKDLGLDYNVFELISQGAVGRRDPSRQAGDLPAARRRHLVAQPPGQEAGAGSRSRRARVSRSRSTTSASPTDRSSSTSPVGTSGVRGAEAFRSSRREAVVQVRAGPLLDRDQRTCRSAAPIRRSR